MKAWLTRFLNGKEKGKVEAEEISVEHSQKEQRQHLEYDLDYALTGLSSRDYGWSDSVQLPKRYILRNINEYKGKISAMGLVYAWRGTGHSEWECLLASLFICDLLEAWQECRAEADITNLFEKDLTASGGRVFTKEQIKEHILPTFTIEEEDEEAIYLVLNVK